MPRQFLFKIEDKLLFRIESDAPESDILNMLDKADKHAPLHDLFERRMKMTRHVEINPAND